MLGVLMPHSHSCCTMSTYMCSQQTATCQCWEDHCRLQWFLTMEEQSRRRYSSKLDPRVHTAWCLSPNTCPELVRQMDEFWTAYGLTAASWCAHRGQRRIHTHLCMPASDRQFDCLCCTTCQHNSTAHEDSRTDCAAGHHTLQTAQLAFVQNHKRRIT